MNSKKYLVYSEEHMEIMNLKALISKFKVSAKELLFFIRNDMYLRDYRIIELNSDIYKYLSPDLKASFKNLSYRKKIRMISKDVITLYKKAIPIDKIAILYDLKPSTISNVLVYNNMHDENIDRYLKKAEMKEREKEILKLYDNGLSGYAIAKKMGLHKNTVLRALKKLKEKGEIKC